MELTPDAPHPARWTEPKAAYDVYRPGLSPYLHYFYDLRAARGDEDAPPTHDPNDGCDVPSQLEDALRALIDKSFG